MEAKTIRAHEIFIALSDVFPAAETVINEGKPNSGFPLIRQISFRELLAQVDVSQQSTCLRAK
jgi:hypothetical protein